MLYEIVLNTGMRLIADLPMDIENIEDDIIKCRQALTMQVVPTNNNSMDMVMVPIVLTNFEHATYTIPKNQIIAYTKVTDLDLVKKFDQIVSTLSNVQASGNFDIPGGSKFLDS